MASAASRLIANTTHTPLVASYLMPSMISGASPCLDFEAVWGVVASHGSVCSFPRGWISTVSMDSSIPLVGVAAGPGLVDSGGWGSSWGSLGVNSGMSLMLRIR